MAKADARARAAARKGLSRSTPAERDRATEAVADDEAVTDLGPARAAGGPARTAASASRPASTTGRTPPTTDRTARTGSRAAAIQRGSSGDAGPTAQRADSGAERRDSAGARRDVGAAGRRDGRALAPLIVPRWLPITSLALILIGLALSAYLTYEHYTASATLACSDNGVVNCLQVTTSTQSKVFGIPVALLGLVYFVAMLPACVPAAWRSRSPWLRNGRIVAGIVGIGFVFYLLYSELFTIGKICLYCTGVHVVTVALFAVVLIGQASVAAPEDR